MLQFRTHHLISEWRSLCLISEFNMATTFAERNSPHFICLGYIRLNCEEINIECNVALTVPTAIILIVIDYYIIFTNPFEWNSEKSDRHLVVSDDKLTVSNYERANGVILAKNLLSSDVVNQQIGKLL